MVGKNSTPRPIFIHKVISFPSIYVYKRYKIIRNNKESRTSNRLQKNIILRLFELTHVIRLDNIQTVRTIDSDITDPTDREALLLESTKSPITIETISAGRCV
jgi:hypothetical protein